jgi:hypothetical protein
MIFHSKIKLHIKNLMGKYLLATLYVTVTYNAKK